jgi:hypothetical protein
MVRVLAAALLLLFAGCGSMSLPGWPKGPPEGAASAGAWTRPGADAATIESAYGECLAATDTATRNDFAIDQDIAASRGGDLQRSDFARTQSREARDTTRDRAQRLLSSCMQGKGFKPAK